MLGNIESYILGDDFNEYVERLEQFFLLNEVDEKKKVSFLITFIGVETYSILKKLLIPVDPCSKTYAELVNILKKHFAPEINEIPERFKFHK